MPNNTYEYVYNPKHPRAFKDGCVYKHILVAEEILQRPLNEKEEVHHRDENRKNNSPSNIIIFKTGEDHHRFHKQYSGIVETGDGTCVCEEIKKLCEVCGKPLHSKKSKYCQKCEREKKAEHLPSKELLQTLLWKEPSTTIGKRFGVSSKAVEKWCKKYGINKPPRGYWTKYKS
jgi:hypothetical protein